jgi:hypothetical protein
MARDDSARIPPQGQVASCATANQVHDLAVFNLADSF